MKILRALSSILIIIFMLSGCNNSDKPIAQSNLSNSVKVIQNAEQDIRKESEEMAESYRQIYERAFKGTMLDELDTVKKIIECLGNSGYPVIDYENQVDMVNAEKAEEFVKTVKSKKYAELTIIRVMYNGGFMRYDLKTAGGAVDIIQSSLLWKDNKPEVDYLEDYSADAWVYSENGCLFFEKYHSPGICYGHTAIRIAPLDENCRELNRKYVKPFGYGLNNMFLSDWNENDYGNLNFYDLYDIMYRIKYEKSVPYDSPYEGKVYEIPQKEFEDIFITFFKINEEAIQERTIFHEENSTYEYRPRGFYDGAAGTELPYPEVIAYKENADRTITLTVNAVWPEKHLEKAFSHEVVVRPLKNGGVQYVSNHVISADENVEPVWYTHRLTKAPLSGNNESNAE